MPFVNEYMPEDDLAKYDIANINQKAAKSNFKPEWTVDRSKDVYLRFMERDRGFDRKHDFTFYWQGKLFWVSLKKQEVIGVAGEYEGTRWSLWPAPKQTVLNVPDDLEQHYDEVVQDLKDALTVFKTAGTYSDDTTHTAFFDF